MGHLPFVNTWACSFSTWASSQGFLTGRHSFERGLDHAEQTGFGILRGLLNGAGVPGLQEGVAFHSLAPPCFFLGGGEDEMASEPGARDPRGQPLQNLTAPSMAKAKFDGPRDRHGCRWQEERARL